VDQLRNSRRQVRISIPFGAIKSLHVQHEKHDDLQFQFLSVRLKVFYIVMGLISVVVFQFLSVRLKGIDRDATRKNKNLFQFLSVRLKERVSRSISRTKFISIPFGAIKSFIIYLFSCFFISISIPFGAIKRAILPRVIKFVL